MAVTLTKIQLAAFSGIVETLQAHRDTGMHLGSLASALGITGAEAEALVVRSPDVQLQGDMVRYEIAPNALDSPGNVRFAAAVRNGGGQQTARESLDIDDAIADARKNAERQRNRQKGR